MVTWFNGVAAICYLFVHILYRGCSKMQAAKDQREAEKDPRKRYEKFLRTAQRPSAGAGGQQGVGQGGNGNGNGSFGGKPRGRKAGGGGRRVVATSVPAWMQQGQGPEGGEL